MKLTIIKNKLKRGLFIIERACSKSLTLPILNNVLFEKEKNFLNLCATDLEIGIKWWGLAKTEKEGKTLLPVRPVSNYISFLPEKPILIEKENSFIKFECENYKTKFKSLDPEEFPIIPKVSEEEFVSIPGFIFSKSLKKVVDFTLPSTTRPEISGVYIIFSKNFIKLVATDSFRLGEKTHTLTKPTKLEKEYAVIVPQRAVKEIINIFGEIEKEIKIYLSTNQISLESEMEEIPHPEILLTSRLIEGEFPDYEAIVPKKFETEITLFKEEFLRQIKMASIFSGKSNEIRLKINPEKDEIEFLSENLELGSYKSLMKGKIKGKNLNIAFNHKFLAEGVSQIEGKELVFQLTDEEGPAILKPFENQNFFYVLMPIKAT
ncbi:hypothetical protein AMJ49_00370 [Parcubacteria bacterium DG_74_2]|nr:MAG: hypothetical protein AMJ49_00370 [Parcubacteria bacterium DG_74_2]